VDPQCAPAWRVGSQRHYGIHDDDRLRFEPTLRVLYPIHSLWKRRGLGIPIAVYTRYLWKRIEDDTSSPGFLVTGQ